MLRLLLNVAEIAKHKLFKIAQVCIWLLHLGNRVRKRSVCCEYYLVRYLEPFANSNLFAFP